MKVTIVCAAGIVSGKEVMALELGQGLRELGTEVCFLTSKWGSGEFARRAEDAGFETLRLWLGFISATLRLDTAWMTLHQLWHWPSLFIAYRRFLKEFGPDKVVHTNWHHLLLLWPLLHPRRDLYWVHELMPNTSRYRTLFRLLNRRVSLFVPVSQAAGQSLADIGIPADKIRVIHNGIADPASDVRPPSGDGKLIIGIVGQIGAWKGHEDLLEAFHVILRDFAAAQLHIFGKGSPDYEMFLHHRISEMDATGSVVWHGFVGDRSQIFSGLTILVVPSRSEDPLPTTAIEAAFFGIPVVATRRGGLAEIVEDGGTGFLVESGKPLELAARISMVLADAGLRRQMGEQARTRAIEKFCRREFITNFSKVLN